MTPRERRIYAWKTLWERTWNALNDDVRKIPEYSREWWRNDFGIPDDKKEDWRVLLSPPVLRRLEHIEENVFDDFFAKIGGFNAPTPTNSSTFTDGPIPFTSFGTSNIRGNNTVIFMRAPISCLRFKFTSHLTPKSYEVPWQWCYMRPSQRICTHIIITDIVPQGKEAPAIKAAIREINAILPPMPPLVKITVQPRYSSAPQLVFDEFAVATAGMNVDGSTTIIKGRRQYVTKPAAALPPRVAGTAQQALADAGLTGEFHVTDALRKAITSTVAVLHATGLKFSLSPEEEQVLVDPHSVICLGRSGTGKTTTALLRLWSRYQGQANQAMSITDGLPLAESPAAPAGQPAAEQAGAPQHPPAAVATAASAAVPAPAGSAAKPPSSGPGQKDFRLHCVFITLSPLLCSQVRTLFLRLYATAKRIASTGDEADVTNPEPGGPDLPPAGPMAGSAPEEPPLGAVPAPPAAAPAQAAPRWSSSGAPSSTWARVEGSVLESVTDSGSTTTAAASDAPSAALLTTTTGRTTGAVAEVSAAAGSGIPEATRAKLAILAAISPAPAAAGPAGPPSGPPRDILECDPSLSDEDYARMLPESLGQLRDEHFPLFLSLDQFLMMLDASIGEPFFARPSHPLRAGPAGGSTASAATPTPMLCWNQGGGQMRRIRRRFVETPTLGLADEDEDEEEIRDEDPAARGADRPGEQAMPRVKKTVRTNGPWSRNIEEVAVVDESSFEVDYPYFAAHMYPKMHEGALEPFPAALVWTEIQTHIKGSAEAFETKAGCLSRDQYLAVGAKRSSMEPADRTAIYGLFQRYEQLKKREELYDRADFVFHLYGQLRTGGYKGIPIHSVTVDEVQDWTQAALKVLFQVCRQPDGFFFGGDTCQTIARGVGFRFCDLQSLFYEQSRRYAVTREDFVPPPLHQLTTNFRTHADILRLCNSVVTLLETLFPNSIERLKHDMGTTSGPKPQLFPFDSAEQLYLLLGGGPEGAGSVIEFGAQQVVLVRTAQAREALPPMLRHALCMTTFEAKGLEFDDVLLYNFFADSPASPEEWQAAMVYAGVAEARPRPSEEDGDGQDEDEDEGPQADGAAATPAASAGAAAGSGAATPAGRKAAKQVAKAQREERKRQRAAQVQQKQQTASSEAAFESHRYHLLCSELKQLYTAVSRARRRVFVFDADVARRRPVLEWWASKGLAQWTDPKLGTAADVATKSTPDQWRERGLELLSRGFYEQARMCFQFAHEEALQTVCQGYLLASRAEDLAAALPRRPGSLREPRLTAGALAITTAERQQRAEAARVFEEAAAKFVEGGAPPLLGARALASAGLYDRAAALFEAAGRVDLACECFTLGAAWAEAARCQVRLGRPYEAARDFLLAAVGPGARGDEGDCLRQAVECLVQTLSAPPPGGPLATAPEHTHLRTLVECLSLQLLRRDPAGRGPLQRLVAALLPPVGGAAASLEAQVDQLMRAGWPVPAFALLCAGLPSAAPPPTGRVAEALCRALLEALPAVLHAAHHGLAAADPTFDGLGPLVGARCQAALRQLKAPARVLIAAAQLLAPMGWTEAAYALAQPAAPTLAGTLALHAGRFDLPAGLVPGLPPTGDRVLMGQTRTALQAALCHLFLQRMNAEGPQQPPPETGGAASPTPTPTPLLSVAALPPAGSAPSPSPSPAVTAARPAPRPLAVNGHAMEEFAQALGPAATGETDSLAAFVERLLGAAFPAAFLGTVPPLAHPAALGAVTKLLAGFSAPSGAAALPGWPSDPMASEVLAILLGLPAGRPRTQRCGLLDPAPFTASSAPGAALQETRPLGCACVAPHRAPWLMPALRALTSAPPARPSPDAASALWTDVGTPQAVVMALNTVVLMGLQLLHQRLPWWRPRAAPAALPPPSPEPTPSPTLTAGQQQQQQQLNSKQRRQMRKHQEQQLVSQSPTERPPCPHVVRLVAALDLAACLLPDSPALSPADALRMAAFIPRARAFSGLLGRTVLPAHRPLFMLLGLRPGEAATRAGVFPQALQSLAVLGLTGLLPLPEEPAEVLDPADAALVGGLLGEGALARLERMAGHLARREPAARADEESDEGGEGGSSSSERDEDDQSPGPASRAAAMEDVEVDPRQHNKESCCIWGPKTGRHGPRNITAPTVVSSAAAATPAPRVHPLRAAVGAEGRVPLARFLPALFRAMLGCQAADRLAPGARPRAVEATDRLRAVFGLAPDAGGLYTGVATWMGLATPAAAPNPDFITRLAAMAGAAQDLVQRWLLTPEGLPTAELAAECRDVVWAGREDAVVAVEEVPHIWAVFMAGTMAPASTPPSLRLMCSVAALALAAVGLAAAFHELATPAAPPASWQDEVQAWMRAVGQSADLLAALRMLRVGVADVLGRGYPAALMKSCEPVLRRVRGLVMVLLNSLATILLRGESGRLRTPCQDLWLQVAMVSALLSRLLGEPGLPEAALVPDLPTETARLLRGETTAPAPLDRAPPSTVAAAIAAAVTPVAEPVADTLAHYARRISAASAGGAAPTADGYMLVEEAGTPGLPSAAEMQLACRELLLRHADLPPDLRAQCTRVMVDLATSHATEAWGPLVAAHQAWQEQRLAAMRQAALVLTPEQLEEKERLARQQAMQLELKRRRNLKRQRYLLKKAYLSKISGRS
ncbi:putative lupus brain antigen [Paratrimastix pyriformis]|uniref:Lupus brain antigen n=1 Tax=Paratrimastix pyriformis TaxID=342808 RepID=A0ABQ8UXD1_9EUKA|nr:putative lupus brain antigen [Paratrimastix pyriformis]